MRHVQKQHLPVKTCRHCGRTFTWRKKWERDWENVLYCSDACRRGRAVPNQVIGAGRRQEKRKLRP